MLLPDCREQLSRIRRPGLRRKRADLGPRAGDLLEEVVVPGDREVDPVVGQGVLVVELVLGRVGEGEGEGEVEEVEDEAAGGLVSEVALEAPGARQRLPGLRVEVGPRLRGLGEVVEEEVTGAGGRCRRGLRGLPVRTCVGILALVYCRLAMKPLRWVGSALADLRAFPPGRPEDRRPQPPLGATGPRSRGLEVDDRHRAGRLRAPDSHRR